MRVMPIKVCSTLTRIGASPYPGNPFRSGVLRLCKGYSRCILSLTYKAITLASYKARNMEHPVRIELTNNTLLVWLINHGTGRRGKSGWESSLLVYLSNCLFMSAKEHLSIYQFKILRNLVNYFSVISCTHS